MKALKIFFLALIATTFSLGFAACGDEPANDIIGTWKITEISSNNSKYNEWQNEPTTITFKSSGTYSRTGYFGDLTGTWKQDGNTITARYGGLVDYIYEIEELTPTSCTLKMWAAGYTTYIYIRCVKLEK